MSRDRPSVTSRLAGFFAVDDPWERRGDVTRRDWLVGLVVLVAALFAHELVRSVGGLEDVDRPLWAQYLAILLGALVLVPRRRWPLTVAVLAAAHMFVTGMLMPVVMGQLTLQIIYFVATFSGVAWARSRRDMLVVMGGVVLFMFAWIAWQFAVGSAADAYLDETGGSSTGLLGAVTAGVLLTTLVNVLYFGGAIIGGQVAWRAARQRAGLAEQTATIARQSEDLRRRAVVEERLRIARELHDVVAHHVSVIGIQAAAGRRVLTRDPGAAEAALASVEVSAREAVGEMRSLVGTLRDPGEDPATEPVGRTPEPGWADLRALAEETATPGLAVDFALVESAPGDAGTLPAPVGLSVFRIAQEALTNVRRHSTADRVGVVLRVDRAATPSYAEIEVTDNGRPRAGTSGSGLGLLGVRERAASRRGEVDIGPRAVAGYRVRVRFPLEGA